MRALGQASFSTQSEAGLDSTPLSISYVRS